MYSEKVSPLVLYIGSTGVIPDEMEAKAATADEIGAKELKFNNLSDCSLPGFAW
jgi:hypothetical protein